MNTMNMDTLSKKDKQALLTRLLEKKLRSQAAQALPENADASRLRLPDIQKRQETGKAALSFAQKRLWMIDRIDGGSLPYIMSTALRLRGELNIQRLAATLDHLLQANEVLRTRFEAPTPDSPLQHVVENAKVDFQQLACPEGVSNVDELIDQYRQAELNKAFDLERDIPFRARLIELGDQDYCLILSTHHIAADGWSIAIINEQISRIYTELAEGRPVTSHGTGLQYTDYAAWQIQNESAIVSAQLPYWRDKLSEAPASCTFPPDFRRPDVSSHRGANLIQRLDAKQCDAIEHLSQRYRVSTFMVLHGLLSCLLQRFSGESHIIVGTPVANREQPEIANMVGFFVNSLPLYMDMSKPLGFADVLAQSRDCVLEAFTHQQLPFEKLVDELNTDRHTNINPVFQVVLAYNNTVKKPLTLPDLEVTELPAKTLSSKFDLTLNVEEVAANGKNALEISWEYATELYSHQTVESIGRYFALLLETVVEHPDSPVDSLPLLSDVDKRRIHEMNTTTTEHATGDLWSLFEEQVTRYGDKMALWQQEGDRQLSYADLKRRAEQLSSRIARQTGYANSGERVVGIISERSANAVLAMLAIVRLGYTYLPMATSNPKDRTERILNDAACKLVLAENGQLADALPQDGSVDCLLLDDETNYDANLTVVPASNVNQSRLAYIMFTSGTTGLPKGVMIEQRSIVRLVKGIDYAPLEPSDNVLLTGSPTFDATTYEVWGSLLNGCTLSIVGEEVLLDTELLGQVLASKRISTLWLTSPLFNQHAQFKPGIFSGLKQLIVGGDALSVSHVQRVRQSNPDLYVINGYGPTENTTFSVCNRLSPAHSLSGLSSIPIGEPINHSTAYVVNARGHLLPTGVAGELLVGGRGVARGYLNRPELNAEKFADEKDLPFLQGRHEVLYRTGDLACLRADGQIEFLGRLDDQVKIRGFRVELGEIQSILRQHDQVEQAHVLVKQDKQGNKQVIAYLALGKMLDVHDADALKLHVRDFVTRYLPEYMVPSAFVLMEKLPLNKNGKVDQRYLPEPEFSLLKADAPVDAENDTEAALLSIWQSALGVSTISVADNFFAIGGDSILAIQVISSAREQGMQLSVKSLFQAKTIRNLARLVSTVDPVEHQHTVEGEQRLLPIQQLFFDTCDDDISHFNQHVMIHLGRFVSSNRLSSILHWMVEKHDVMRLVFSRAHSGWQAHYATVQPSKVAARIHEHEVRELRGEALNEYCNTVATQAQGSLDIEKGDTYRWLVIRAADETRLIWIMHHLIVDGVSWRVLLRDIERCLNSTGDELPAIVKTSSCQTWANHLHELSAQASFAQEALYWQRIASAERISLPFINTASIDCREVHTREIEIAFPQAITEALLHHASGAYNTQVKDLLLSALLLSLETQLLQQATQPALSLTVDLEGHGREYAGETIDLTETVGWFTTLWPVRLNAQSGDLAQTIMHVKEQLAAVPANGLGYGLMGWHQHRERTSAPDCSELVFNYLGQLDANAAQSAQALSFSLDHCGQPIGQQINRSHPVRITGMVKDQQLRFVFDYNEQQVDAQAIRSLAEQYRQSLEQIVAHCQVADAQRTPSDFPLVNLSQPELDAISARFNGVSDLYPATAMQQSLLFQSIKDHQTEGVYITQLVFSFEEADATLMQKAWQTLSARHAIFRTVFLDVDTDSPLQVVLDDVPIEWRVDRLSEATGGSLAQLADRERATGFDLQERPLQKFLWVHDAALSHLVWTHHHALIDGWCLSILLDELLAIYSALQNDTVHLLPPVKPYRDYVQWLGQTDKSRAEAFWRNYLDGVDSCTRLGVEIHAPGPGNTQLDQEIDLGKTLSAELQRLVKEHHVTLNTVFQAAWGLLLSKYSGEDDLLFGTTVSGRPAELAGAGQMVGLFINTLPVRYRLSNKGLDLGNWFQSIHESTVKANEFSYLSLGEIQHLSGMANSQSLFESVLVFENYPLDLTQLNNRQTGQPRFQQVEGSERSDLPLNLVIYPGSDIKVKLAYRSDRYGADTIGTLLSHYRNLLVSLCDAKTHRIADVNMLGEQEIHQAIQLWNDTDSRYVSDIGLYEQFHQCVQQHPEQVALVFGSQQLTYASLNARVEGIAATLKAAGCGHGMRVVVSVPKGTDLVASLLAVMKLAAVYVPVAQDCPAERLDFIIGDAQVRFAILEAEHTEQCQSRGVGIVDISQVSGQTGQSVTADKPVSGTDEAYVIYTSGTTGKPKGVSIAHRSLLNLCHSFDKEGWIEPGKATLQFAPFTFDASMAEIFVGLLSSATVHIVEDQLINDPPAMQEYLNTHDIRFAAFPPQYLQYLDPATTHSGLRILTAGSAPTLAQVKAWGENHRYINAYGPTETTVLSSAWSYRASEVEAGKISIGQPLSNTQIYVVDIFGQLCAPGQKGEIYIGGDGVALGYLNNEALNKKHFIANPWKAQGRLYRTGDLGRWLDNGNIEFIGRCDDQVKIRGFRIEPDEVERCCLQHREVDICTVMARPDAFGDLMLVAYVQSSAQESVLSAELKQHIAQSLPAYMMPSHVVVLREFPMTGNGKVDRKALAQIKLEKRRSVQADESAEVTEQEEQLLHIWRQYLSNDCLQVNDDFFEHGGNSILLLRMMKPMKTAGFDIPVNEMYQRRTVRKCCELFSQSIDSLISTWKARDIQFEIVTHMDRGVRTDFWLLQDDQAFDEQELARYFANMDGASLPDYIRFVPDLNKARHAFAVDGKHALSGWSRPYAQSLKQELNDKVDVFHAQFTACEISKTIWFTPMQESMVEWEERSVFELISIYGWYGEEALQAAFKELVSEQELLRALNHKDRRWDVVSAEQFDVDIPCLDIRFLDDHSQNRFILSAADELQAWQKKSGLPYVACWVTVSDTRHYFVMLNDHLISDESSSLAIKSKLNQVLQGKPRQLGRHFSDYALHLRDRITQDNGDFVRQRTDIHAIIEAKKATEEILVARKKMPIRRLLMRVPLEKKRSALDQSFIIFRRIAAHILDQKEFCMVMNHFGRQIEGQNDFHQVGLFLDKIPFVVNERTRLEDINTVVDELGARGISFVGLAEHSLLGGKACLPTLSNEVLFNYQGDQQKDPMVQQWFSQLNLNKAMKKFNGIVFEARQLDRELSVHCIFRGKKHDPEELLGLIEGARLADRLLDSKYYNATYWQRIKSVARDPLYTRLTANGEYHQAIQVRDVKKRYGDFEAVKGVSFSVEKGKCFGILGPNGAGKTTLLSMMEGINSIDSGTIQILNLDVQTQLKEIQPHIGVQLQQNNYFQFLNVEEMLLFYRDLRTAVSGRSKGQSIDELLDKLSLSDKRKSLVDELSGGQQQRLTIAIAMLNEPDIVFLDEPTSALDPQTRRYIWDYIEHLKESGDKTIIITTHYMEEAERLCDEIIIMNEGRITAQGSPDQLIDDLNAHYDISVLLGKGDIDDNTIHSFTGVTNLHWGTGRREFTISTTESAKTLKELFAYIEESDIELLQFHIDRPSLEDVFISNTGKELRE